MLASLLGKRNTAPRDPAALAAARLTAEADAARDSGDLEEAVRCYQAAMDVSPLNRDLRDAFADVLMEVAERRASRRKGPRAGVSSRMIDPSDEYDDNPEPPRPRRRTSARRKPPASKSPARHSAPRETPPLGLRIPNLEEPPQTDEFDTEELEVEPPKRGFFGFADLDDRRTRAASLRKDRREETPTRRSTRRRFSPKVLVLTGFYAGLLMVGVGLSHGMIVRLLGPAELPSVEATAPALPEELSADLRRAEALLSSGDPKAALEILDAAAAAFPGHLEALDFARSTALRSRGSRLLDNRDYDAAAEAYRRATALRPNDASNWIDLARVYREHGRSIQASDKAGARGLLDQARAACEQALEVRPDDPAALLGLAQTYAFLSRRNEAVSNYEQVLDVAPDSPEARLAREHLAQLRG